MTYSSIHVWGDSLARGIVYQEKKQRYAISKERCTTRLAQSTGLQVENHSTMGATVLDGLALFEGFKGESGALCAVEFGGNDCDLDWASVSANPQAPIEAKVPLTLFEDSLGRFVKAIRKQNMEPLLITPLPLHAERYFQWVTRGLDAQAILLALGDVNHIYRWQERYANAVRNVARATSTTLLDLRDMLLAQPDYADLMCLDGIHPNDEGHKRLSDAVLQIVRNKLNPLPARADQEADEAYLTAIPSISWLQ